jgi:CRISPR-associated exonuclease Cas4
MISASHITYLHLCHRKLWLHHRGMRMENNSSAVIEGQLIGKNTYNRRAKKWKELNLENLKIDHYDPSTNTIREVKKSSKLEFAHIAQVKYYIYALAKRGVPNTKGIIEYPKQKKTTHVELTPADEQEIQQWETQVQQIVEAPTCPELIEKTYCRNCAFRDFCFI